jgi:uncharacterized protein with HEPN domain
VTDRDVRLLLQDMHNAAEAIAAVVENLDFAAFTNDDLRRKSVVHDFMVLGEAASRVPAEIRDLSPDIPWRDIVAMRNKLIHAYFGVELAIVFRAAIAELPELRRQLQALRAALDSRD